MMHQFGELDAKAEQRFAVGIGPRKFAFRRQHLSMRDRASLVSFWESLQGAWKSFTYNVPNPDQTTSRHEGDLGVRAALDPVSGECLPGRVQLHRGPQSLGRAQLSRQFHLPALSLHYPPNRAAEPGPADHSAGPHPRARAGGARHLSLGPPLHGRRPALPAARARSGRTRVGRHHLPGHQGDRRQRPVHVRQRRPRDDRARERHGPEVRQHRPLALPRQHRHPAPVVGGVHRRLRLRRLAAIHRARQRWAVPDHADVPRAGHLAAVLEDLQRWRELPVRGARPRRRSRPPAITTSIPPTAARRTA